MELHRPAALERRHDRTRFDCGNPALNDYLRRTALSSQRSDFARTWVITDTTDRVVAYMTLAMTGVDRGAAPALAAGASAVVPAVLIGRLAVDRSVARRGVGTQLALHGIRFAVAARGTIGCKAVVVDALDRTARTWWQGLGFRPFDASDPDCLSLYLTTKDALATIAAL